MFKSDDTTRLRRQLDRFAVPMFIAELRADDSQFEFRAINAAHERNSGMVMQDVIHRPLCDLLPREQARHVNNHYSECIHAEGPIRYREQLRLPSGLAIWDTSLCRLTLPDGRERVVGSAVIVQRIQRDQQDTLAFQDVEYFAATSSMRLAQISDVLDAVEAGRISADQLAGSAGMLAGLCRSVDETLRELRSIVSHRLASTPQVVPLLGCGSDTFPHEDCEVDKAISALIHIAKNLSANVDCPVTTSVKHPAENTPNRANR